MAGASPLGELVTLLDHLAQSEGLAKIQADTRQLVPLILTTFVALGILLAITLVQLLGELHRINRNVVTNNDWLVLIQQTCGGN